MTDDELSEGKKRHDEKYSNDTTPSRQVVENYRAKFQEEDSDVGLALVHYRGGKEEFELGVEYARSSDFWDRVVGADVLAQLGWGDRTFLDESVDLLISLLDDENPIVVSAAGVGLGHRSEERAIPALLRHAKDENNSVRYGVVFGIMGSERQDAAEALVELCRDGDFDVRNWAVFGLGSLMEADSPNIREVLWETLGDSESEIRGEALVGLARRKDARVKDAILAEWEGEKISVLSIEAAEELGDRDLVNAMKGFLERFDLEGDPYFKGHLLDAITACEGDATDGDSN